MGQFCMRSIMDTAETIKWWPSMENFQKEKKTFEKQLKFYLDRLKESSLFTWHHNLWHVSGILSNLLKIRKRFFPNFHVLNRSLSRDRWRIWNTLKFHLHFLMILLLKGHHLHPVRIWYGQFQPKKWKPMHNRGQ